MRFKLNYTRLLLILLTITVSWSAGRRFNSWMLVSGRSMVPALQDGKLVHLNRSVPAQLRRGLIVVSENGDRSLSIKRLVGLPNETISFDRGEVFVNGAMLYEPYLPEDVTTFSWNYARLVTGEDEYVVLGDNRPVSEDSRDYGVVPRSRIIGVVPVEGAAPELLSQPHYRISLRNVPSAGGDAFPWRDAAGTFHSL